MYQFVQNFSARVKENFIFYYGPDHPQRLWNIVLTVFFLMCFPRFSRRYGAIGLAVGVLCFVVWGFLSDVFQQTAPDPLP
jgi:hypothetical protein